MSELLLYIIEVHIKKFKFSNNLAINDFRFCLLLLSFCFSFEYNLFNISIKNVKISSILLTLKILSILFFISLKGIISGIRQNSKILILLFFIGFFPIIKFYPIKF